MKQLLCRVVENHTLWADIQLLALDAPELDMRPGQFALVRDPVSFDPYLRRTAWFYRRDNGAHTEDTRVAFTLPTRDPLVQRTHVGDVMDVLAPLGRQIDFEASAQHILLLGEGYRVAPLLAVAESAVKQNRAVTLLTRGDPFAAHLLPPEVEYRAEEAPNAELIAWADTVIASGSDDWYRLIGETVRATRYRLEPGFLRVIVDLPMPCGIGACGACAVSSASRRVRWACTDGPIFDWVELERAR